MRAARQMVGRAYLANMRIVDLDEEHEPLYFACLEPWSEEMKEAGDRKALWYEKHRDRGLSVKLAIDDQGVVTGMIQLMPVEQSWVLGEGLYFVPCIWVHRHKEGIGDQSGHGIGTALLEAAEEEARQRGAKGIVAWGLALPFWMKASWFQKHGYEKVDRAGIAKLVWKPFTEDAAPPKWMRQKKSPERVDGKVVVTVCNNGWCPAQNIAYERAKRAAEGLGEDVQFELIDTSDLATLHEWGVPDAVFIDGKQVWTGPPPSCEKLTRLMKKRLRKLGR